MTALRNILILTIPPALLCFIFHLVAKEWGSQGVLAICLGLGAVCGFGVAISQNLSPYQTCKMTRAGLLPGLVLGGILAAILSWMGYENDTGPGKKHEARLAAVELAMINAARNADLPFDKLLPAVKRELDNLPDHPSDRSISVVGLIARLKHPNPLVRSQAMLALGRYEGYPDRIVPVLEIGMQADEPRMRAAAVTAIAAMRPLSAAMQSQILAMMSDKDRDVQLAAATAAIKTSLLVNPPPRNSGRNVGRNLPLGELP
jgi:HEAT repeat protein